MTLPTALHMPTTADANIAVRVFCAYLDASRDPREWIKRDAALHDVQRFIAQPPGDTNPNIAWARSVALISMVIVQHANAVRRGVAPRPAPPNPEDDAAPGAARLCLLAELDNDDAGQLDILRRMRALWGIESLVDVFVGAVEQLPRDELG